ncbi:MAG TPA: hypothetical protein VLD63_04995 [Anaerolineales bacterium]|nr:hypothetical protein [Anaerolineales bacterium]
MASTPAQTVDDSFVAGLACPICNIGQLAVQHIDNFPDYVTCSHCGSAFVVEDTGERVMYGRISPDYPQVSAFALKQWVWLEAVRRRAEAERPAPPAPVAVREPAAEEEIVEEEPVEGGDVEPSWLGDRLRSTSGLSAGVPIPTEPEPAHWERPPVVLSPESEPLPDWLRSGRATPVEPPPPSPAAPSAPAPVAAPAQAAAAPSAVPSEEPAAQQRTRVTLRGDRVRFPINACAHCLRTPAPARWPVVGSLPRPKTLGGRRSATFRIPLCASCRKRAAASSSDQTSARLQAHLISALVALAVIVGALALNLVSFDGNPLGSLAILAVLAVLGYAIPAVAMLGRASRVSVPPDAEFVRSTLLVRGSPLSPETVFAWRNAGYADMFFQSNQAAASRGPEPTDEDADIE